ncbi:endonuclease/exonuclease/phosphatase family protein [Pseudoxanthomonas sp.]|uniref:endonuclease/exonuclease/phosphatase family protein n=1 Tax=Pseudoxanthomonas sp. TaxID=1871049 RepID=UPI00262D308B|nr:endonuclease/exonuclease/phosphatase family protein [Pseudoxanthomonas sp.]WDS37908.1 MAG: endonuclease/exonuclease/phosphatase family protein [Pseudoxanthomonas sp.]
MFLFRAPHRRFRLLLILMVLPVAAALADTPTLKVMSFNVRTPADTNDNRWENRRDLMAQTIRTQDPDVIGTQELVKQQADDLVARLPQYAWFGEGRRGGDGDEHMGVFYRTDRLKVLESGNFWLSDTPDVPGSITWGNLYPRLVTWARFRRTADGATFVLYDTHFPYRDQDDAARLKSAQLIIKRIAGLPKDEPFVLTGDFNTTDRDPAHAALTAVLKDAWLAGAPRSGPEATFHDFTGTPDRRLDWILFRGLALRRVDTLTVHNGPRYPSDHFPVVAVFDLPAPKTAPH